MSQRGLAALCGKEFLNLGKFQRQALFGDGAGYAVLVVDGEGLAPVALAAEDGVAQTEVYLDASQFVLSNIFLGCSNGLYHCKTVE